MTYELEIKKPSFLVIKIKGKRTVDSIKEVTKQIVEKCEDNKISKVLVDVREFEERIKFSEIFDLASKQLPKIINNKINKVAIVDLKGFDYNKNFFENVARNRSHDVKIFTEYNEAVQWLS
ncbi:hypothetical protein AYK24_07515 [Thermoplasmatales archaeon SG8-52-4]|nr:MAG: hypothetical protein AYK24_07515 [Thermoplasmatales archaeon SG8-52-4]